jgi:TRAP-type C4-dicarboxylate transport system permease small subunit
VSQTDAAAPAPAAGAAFRTFRSGLVGLDRVSFLVIVVAMAGMTAIVAIQVFYRYVLNNSIDSADELSRLLFVWAMFLAVPHGIRRGVHVGIDLAVALVPVRWRESLFRVTCLLGLLLMIVVLAAGIRVTGDKWQELMPTIEVTAAVYYIAVVICAAHSVLHLLLLAWGGQAAWKGVDE